MVPISDGRGAVPETPAPVPPRGRLAGIVPLLLTVGAGALLAWQSRVNAQLADSAQSWLLAALVSFTVGTLALSVLSLGSHSALVGFILVLSDWLERPWLYFCRCLP